MLKNSKIGYNWLFQIIIEYCKRFQNIWNTGTSPLGGLGGGGAGGGGGGGPPAPPPPPQKKKFCSCNEFRYFQVECILLIVHLV